VARTSYFRAVTVLLAMMAAAIVAVLVGYGSVLAQTTSSSLQAKAGAPTVRSTVPADNAINVDRNANITARFSERMLRSSISGDTVQLYRGSFTAQDLNPDPNCTMDCPATPVPVGASVSYVVQKKDMKRIPYAVLDPTFTLEPDTPYTLLIEGAGDLDGFAVKDRAGHAMAAEKIVHFRTVPGPVG
jgi:hypothetical protein